jgi:formamidopyrimidine-DNA glycosylase
MPELVEVENFRRILLCLKQDANSNPTLQIELPSPTVPKVFPTKSEIKILKKCVVKDVERKGKLLRLILQQSDKKVDKNVFLYLHMGMTGRISTPGNIPSLESLAASETFPPPHTHLIFKVNNEEVAYSDPRRFGAVSFDEPLSSKWEEFALDALHPEATLENLIGQKKKVKALLLDQRAIVSGVGNWIADEILYQSKMHPDQSFLSPGEVEVLQDSLSKVLNTGIQCISTREEYPKDWLFHRRWSKGKSSTEKDCDGNCVKFVKSAGRTSAIVAFVQKLQPRNKMYEISSGSADAKPVHSSDPHQVKMQVKEESSPPRKSRRIK